MKIETYRKAESLMKELDNLNDLSLCLKYNDANEITITNNTGITRTFNSKTFFEMLGRFIEQEASIIDQEFGKL